MRKSSSSASAALILICLGAVAARAQKETLPFIKDDYAQALAQGRQRNLPLFVEVWAPW